MTSHNIQCFYANKASSQAETLYNKRDASASATVNSAPAVPSQPETHESTPNDFGKTST